MIEPDPEDAQRAIDAEMAKEAALEGLKNLAEKVNYGMNVDPKDARDREVRMHLLSLVLPNKGAALRPTEIIGIVEQLKDYVEKGPAEKPEIKVVASTWLLNEQAKAIGVVRIMSDDSIALYFDYADGAQNLVEEITNRDLAGITMAYKYKE